MDKKITGTMFVRKTGANPPGDDSNRTVYIIVGLIAIPDDVKIENETQYIAIGSDREGVLDISIMKNYGTDRTHEGRGQSVDGLLRLPIWRT